MSATKPTASPTTYALLGLLAARSWTGYELTQQLRRSLHLIWPSSEGHLYREQRRLVDLGWATVTREPAGKRHRQRYTITAAGGRAVRDWLRTEPGEPRFEIEAVVRMFYGNQGEVEDLLRAIDSTRGMAAEMLSTLLGFAAEYLEEGGPLWMLERGIEASGGERAIFRGRPQFPERLHSVALVLEVMTTLLAALTQSLSASASEIRNWPSTTDPRITPATRRRLERIIQRHRLPARS